jgi:hypothetical protein
VGTDNVVRLEPVLTAAMRSATSNVAPPPLHGWPATAHVQRLVLVVKMETVLQDFTTEEQRSVVRFYGQKDSMQRVFIKKCFLFTVGSVCRVKVANVLLMTKR